MSDPDWPEHYRVKRPHYEAMTELMKHLLSSLLRQRQIPVAHVEGRAKTVGSFTEKIARKKNKYRDPIRDMTDLIGIRIITYYLEDVDSVGNMIQEEFTLDQANSLKRRQASPDQFGYISDHFVVSLSRSRALLTEWTPYRDVKCEIQVRTILQHAWASVNHKLDYKTAREIPAELRRRLFRLSALFEIADEQFSNLRLATRELERSYADSVDRHDLSLLLDAASLDAYFETRHAAFARLVEVLPSTGWRISGDDEMRHDYTAADRNTLLKTCGLLDITRLSELDRAIERALPDAPEILRSWRGLVSESTGIDPSEVVPNTSYELVKWLLVTDVLSSPEHWDGGRPAEALFNQLSDEEKTHLKKIADGNHPDETGQNA